MNDQILKGYAFLSLPILGWGLAPIIIDFGLKLIEPLPFLMWRFFVALLVSIPYILIKKRDAFKPLLKTKWTLIVGLSQVWAMVTQYLSQLYISPSISATISYSYLILVPFVSYILIGTRIEKYHLSVVLAAIVGVLMISISGGVTDGSQLNIIGIMFAALSSLGFAVYIVSTSRIMSDDNIDGGALYFTILLFVSITSFLLSQIFGSNINPTLINGEAWIYISILALFSTIIAYVAYIQSMKYLSPNVASVLLLLQIVIPYIIEMFMDKFYSYYVYAGCIMILIASTLVILHK